MSNFAALQKALDMLEPAIGVMTSEQMLAAVGNVETMAPNFGAALERTHLGFIRISHEMQVENFGPVTCEQFRAWLESKRAMLVAHPYVAA